MILISPQSLQRLIDQYQISALWQFGSSVRDDHTAVSDIDLVVDFSPEASPTLLTLASMERELEKICNRKVDIVTRKAIEEYMNPILKREIISTMVQIYGT